MAGHGATPEGDPVSAEAEAVFSRVRHDRPHGELQVTRVNPFLIRVIPQEGLQFLISKRF